MSLQPGRQQRPARPQLIDLGDSSGIIFPGAAYPALREWLRLAVMQMASQAGGRKQPSLGTALAYCRALLEEGCALEAARSAARFPAVPWRQVPPDGPSRVFASGSVQITLREAAILTGRSKERIRQLVHEGQLAAARDEAGRWLVSREDVTGYVQRDGGQRGPGSNGSGAAA